MNINKEQIKEYVIKYFNQSIDYVQSHKKNTIIICSTITIVLLYGLSRVTEPKIKHYQINQQKAEFNNGKMFLSNNSQSISHGKNRAINKKINKVKNDQASLFEQLKLMDQKFAALESKNIDLQKKINISKTQAVAQLKDPKQADLKAEGKIVIDEVAVAQSATRVQHSNTAPLCNI